MPPDPMTVAPADWYSVRRAVNSKPSTYRCPFCNKHLLALTEHVLVAPEGDTTRRRHAHTECTLRARRAGSLPSHEEWKATQPREPGWVSKWLLRRGTPASRPLQSDRRGADRGTASIAKGW